MPPDQNQNVEIIGAVRANQIFDAMVTTCVDGTITDRADDDGLIFDRKSHVEYFQACLKVLPHYYVGLDTTRLSAVYFCTLGLDILGAGLEGAERESVIEFVYSNQLDSNLGKSLPGYCGFVGSSYCGQNFGGCCRSDGRNAISDLAINSIHSEEQSISKCIKATSSKYIQGNLAMSYTALSTLVCLDDDLSRVDKHSLLQGMRDLQEADGSFKATLDGGECDVRFLYCACAVSALLDDWSGVNKKAAVQYILSCVTYEGGTSLVPGAEAHGGATYCCVASLCLLGAIDDVEEVVLERLRHWCLHRQTNGYSGRTNKECDSCYSFWIGAALKLLGSFEESDFQYTRAFLLQKCQQHTTYRGGFSKVPHSPPDILHSFYSVCWLSLLSSERKEIGREKEKEEGEENEKKENESYQDQQSQRCHQCDSKGQDTSANERLESSLSSVDWSTHTAVPRSEVSASSMEPFSVDIESDRKGNSIFSGLESLRSIDPKFALCTTKCPVIPH